MSNCRGSFAFRCQYGQLYICHQAAAVNGPQYISLDMTFVVTATVIFLCCGVRRKYHHITSYSKNSKGTIHILINLMLWEFRINFIRFYYYSRLIIKLHMQNTAMICRYMLGTFQSRVVTKPILMLPSQIVCYSFVLYAVRDYDYSHKYRSSCFLT